MNLIEIENQTLRRQLQSLMDEARVNEKKWRRLDQLEKQLISTHTLPDLIQAILSDYKAASETDAVTLVLSDPDCEIRHILEIDKPGGAELPGLVLLEKLDSGKFPPYLGTFDPEVHRAIFNPQPAECKSMVLLPLMRQNALIGSLNLASCSARRFAKDSSTDFLERLANIFAICLENALNHERLKQIGLTDPLTGIFNRRYFESRCQEEIANIRRYKTPLTCLFLDVDKFKQVNDNFGHHAGDEVLRGVARQIKSQLRGNDVLARFGGEEFVVLLPQTGLETASEIAERIRFTVAEHPFQMTAKDNQAVTISIGVSRVPDDLEGDDTTIALKLLSAADEALFVAKKNGRNKVVIEERKPTGVGVINSFSKLINFN
jgi:two-component system cell cycle response regulator